MQSRIFASTAVDSNESPRLLREIPKQHIAVETDHSDEMGCCAIAGPCLRSTPVSQAYVSRLSGQFPSESPERVHTLRLLIEDTFNANSSRQSRRHPHAHWNRDLLARCHRCDSLIFYRCGKRKRERKGLPFGCFICKLFNADSCSCRIRRTMAPMCWPTRSLLGAGPWIADAGAGVRCAGVPLKPR